MALKALFARAPLMDTKKAPLPMGQLTLNGDLKKKIDALAKETAQGELSPYALRALTLGAFLLRDDELIEKCEKAIMDSPLFSDGDMPLSDALEIAHAALIWYANSTDKALLVPLMRLGKRIEASEDAELLKNPADATELMLNLYNLTGKKGLLNIIADLRERAMDWTSILHTFEIVKPFERMVKLKTPENAEEEAYYARQKAMGDGLSVARNLKTPALFALFSGNGKETEAPMAGYKRLMRYHGIAGSLFTAAPYLSGRGFDKPMSYAAMGELAYSLATIAKVDETALDALEKVALNGLMAYSGGEYHYVNDKKQEGSAAASVLKGLAAYACAGVVVCADGAAGIEMFMPVELKIKTALGSMKIVERATDTEVTLKVSAGKEMRGKIRIRVPEWAGEAYAQIGTEPGKTKDDTGAILLEADFAKKSSEIKVNLYPEIKAAEGYRESRVFEYGPYVLARSESKAKDFIQADVFGKAEKLVYYKDAKGRVAQFEAP